MAKREETAPAAGPDLLLLGPDSLKRATPIHLVNKASWGELAKTLEPAAQRFAEASGFDGSPGKLVLLPAAVGGLSAAVFGLADGEEGDGPLAAGQLPGLLPPGDYRLEGTAAADAEAALGWVLGAYAFDRYKSKRSDKLRRLALTKEIDRGRVLSMARAVYLGRDLINTPANDLGPEELEAAARTLARSCKAEVSSIVGDRLLAENFPMLHAVGRASARAPRLVDLRWGKASHRTVTLVGKGICFDTGGLNIKTGDSMSLMKKDMGGAATALALAAMIMEAKLPVRLRVLLAIAENAIAGNAFRPGDILKSRNGMTVEIGNTDAEGRLVLADAMALGGEETPDIMLTFATLTGAARVALGPDLPPFYCTDDAIADRIIAAGRAVDDPVWRMPFWQPYDQLLKSQIADVNHISGGPHAGSVTAAMFLKRFAPKGTVYGHFDVFCWVPRAKPGRPVGGEPQAARAVFHALERMVGET
ncbi:MAG: leucyl aminopeptidase family protein [Hyphomicrobiaceae bacterium]